MEGQLGGQYRTYNERGHSPLASSQRRNRAQAEAKLVTVNHLMVVAGVWFLSIGLFVALFSPAMWLTGMFGLTLPALPTLTRWAVGRARTEQNQRGRIGRRQNASLRLRVHRWLRARLGGSSSGRNRL